MAQEQIIVEYVADIQGFRAQLKSVEDSLKKVETTSKQSAEASKKHFQSSADSIKQGATQIAGALGLAFGVHKVIEFGKESVKAFVEAEENAHKLRFAVEKIGGEGTIAFKKLIEQSEKLQKSTIFSDDSIQQAQTALATFGLTSDQIEALIPQIADMASATGVDLATATQKAIQGINGQTRGLKEVGIQFSDTGSKTENLAILTEKLTKFQGASAEALETTAGKAKKLENAFGDIQEKIGEYLVNEGAKILDNFEIVFGGKAQEIATRNATSGALKILEEINEKNIAKIQSGEKTKYQVIADNNKFIAELFKARGQQENAEQQKNIDAQIRAVQKANEDLRNLGKEGKIKDDATTGGKDAKIEEEKDLLEELRNLDIKADEASLAQQAKTDSEKLELARASALQEVQVAEKLAIDLGASKADATAISQNAIAKINETFNNAQSDLALKQYNESADKLNAEIDKDEADKLEKKKKRLAEEEKLVKESEARKKLARKQTEEAVGASIDAFQQISANATQHEINDIDKKTQKQIDSLNYQLEHKLISQETYDKKVEALEKEKEEKQRKLKKQQFETDRQIAIVKAIIATAQAVITQFAETGYYGAILAGVVGAAQIAIIASEPTPQFGKGGKVKGKLHTQGGTIVEAERDEWIIKRDESMKNDKLLRAINDGKGDKYILDHYIAPALMMQQKKSSSNKEQSFTKNLADSMNLNFKDGNLLDSLKQSRKNDKEIAQFIVKNLKANEKDARRF